MNQFDSDRLVALAAREEAGRLDNRNYMRLSFLTFPKGLTPETLDGILRMIAMTREKFLASHLLKEVAGCVGSPHVGTGERLILVSSSYGADATYSNANELTFQGASDTSTFFLLIEEVTGDNSLTRWFGVSENLKSFRFMPWGTTRIPVGYLKVRIGTQWTGADPRMVMTPTMIPGGATLAEILGTSGPGVPKGVELTGVYTSDTATPGSWAKVPDVMDFTITTRSSSGSDVTGTEADFA